MGGDAAGGEKASAKGDTNPKGAAHIGFLALALILNLAVIISVLLSSDFLPYITDNNESFSTFIHANNMLRFGFWSTAGLTDEANSSDKTAHPYVYTHEGNFPRFPVLGLLLLGINRLEWQITALALILGSLSLYFCYEVFSRIGGDLFAFLVAAFFSTDYLLYVQWQVNTFRVWHALLLFVSLYGVQRINNKNRLAIGAALFLSSLALFYFEIVFAFFVTLFSWFYAAILYRNRPRLVLWVVMGTSLGALVALALLLGQLFGHLGAGSAWNDIQLTYLTRSFGDIGGGVEAHWRKLHFFIDNHIAYWDSTSSYGLPSIPALIEMLRQGIVRVYTPFFVLVGGILTLTLLLDGKAVRIALRTLYEMGRGPAIAQALQSPGGLRWKFWLGTAALSLVVWTVTRLGLHSPAHIHLWAGVIRAQISGVTLQLILLASLLWSVLFLSSGTRRHLLERVDGTVRAAAQYLLAGSAAFLVLYVVFPTYVWNGYLSRYAPVVVFFSDVWLALLLYILLILTYQTGQAFRHSWGTFGASANRGPVISQVKGLAAPVPLFASSLALLLSLAGYWVTLQVEYFAKLPPTAILFMRRMALPEFQHASFISDNYALPIVYFTKQWAYQDQVVPLNAPVTGENTPALYISGKYIWFADRDTNAAYSHPQYYLCRINPTLDVVEALTEPRTGQPPTCSAQRIVEAALLGLRHPFQNTLVAHDGVSSDMWAIVRLDSKIRLIPKD